MISSCCFATKQFAVVDESEPPPNKTYQVDTSRVNLGNACEGKLVALTKGVKDAWQQHAQELCGMCHTGSKCIHRLLECEELMQRRVSLLIAISVGEGDDGEQSKFKLAPLSDAKNNCECQCCQLANQT